MEQAPAPPDGAVAPLVISGARWVGLSTLVGMATTWVTTIALARMLTREEFGLAALAMLAVAVLSLFQDSGLHAALIQRRENFQAAVDTAALYAPLSGLALGGLCAAAAPLAGLFFHESGVVPLVEALGGVLVLRSLTVVPNAILQREFLFARQSMVGISGAVLQTGTAIALAAAGAGAWAIIGGQLVASAWSAALLWPLCPLRPHPTRASFRELRTLLRYGRHIVAGNVVGFVNSSTDFTLVGRLFGAPSLGAYTIGFSTGRYAVTTVTRVSNMLVFPAYAKLQSDIEHLQRAYLRSLRFISVISMPAALGLAAVSYDFVRVVYGGKWSAAAPVLAVICFHGLFLSVSGTTGELFKASGRPELFFRMGVLQIVVLLVLIASLYPFGIVGFAGARAGAAFVMGWVALSRAGEIVRLRIVDWLHALAPSFTAAAVMAAGVWATRLAIEQATGPVSGAILAGLVVEGIVLYAAAMRILAASQWAEFLAELGRLSAFTGLRGRLRASGPNSTRGQET